MLLAPSVVLSNTANTPPNAPQSPQTIVYEEAIANGLNPKTFFAIATCESQMREFDKDGNVLRGMVNPHDIGLFQISETYWLDVSNKLGYDIYTVTGNIEMAIYIQKNYGTEPWKASESCWGQV